MSRWLLLLLAGLAGCAVRTEGPPRIDLDRTSCGHCGMLISDARFAAAYQAHGSEPRVFDDIGCLLDALAHEPVTDGPRFWFHDYETSQWIEGAGATLLTSSQIRTPMDGGIVAFRDPAAAQRTAAAVDGRIVRTVNDLLNERKRVSRD